MIANDGAGSEVVTAAGAGQINDRSIVGDGSAVTIPVGVGEARMI